MERANVRSLRFRFPWVKIEQQQPTGGLCRTAIYDWGLYDRIVAGASRGGVKILPVIAGSPRYVAASSRRAPETRVPREIEPFECFVRALVHRYGRGGTFVRPRGLSPITEWQVWNEPNLRMFSPNGVADPREYARLLRTASTLIRARDPQATVVVGGMPEVTGSGSSIHSFLRGFYRVQGIRRHFRVVAMHPYARTARGVEGALQRLRATLRGVGDRRRVVWITEVGWATRGTGGLTFLRKTEKGQATELRRTFKMLRAKRSRYRVGTVHWFRWRDTRLYSQRGGVFDFAGLFKRNGMPKPSCRAFANFTNGRCTPITGAGSATATVSAHVAREAVAEAVEPSAPE